MGDEINDFGEAGRVLGMVLVDRLHRYVRHCW